MPGCSVSCVDVCSRAGAAAPQGGAAVLRNLESGNKDLNEEREVLQRAWENIAPDIRGVNMRWFSPTLGKGSLLGAWEESLTRVHLNSSAMSLPCHVPRETVHPHRASSQHCLGAVPLFRTSDTMTGMKCQQQRDTLQPLGFGWGILHTYAPAVSPKILAHPLAPLSYFNLQIIGAGRSTGAKGFCQAELKAAAAAATVAAGRAQPEMTSPSCSSSLCIFIPGKSPAKPVFSEKAKWEHSARRRNPLSLLYHSSISCARYTWEMRLKEESRIFLSTLGRS